MRRECVLEPLHKDDASNDALTFPLLNTRSFHKHDDRVLFNTDVLCLTEIQILPYRKTKNISEVLTNFNYYIFPRREKYMLKPDFHHNRLTTFLCILQNHI